MSTTAEIWDFIDAWLTGWMATHPKEERESLHILLSLDFQDLTEGRT